MAEPRHKRAPTAVQGNSIIPSLDDSTLVKVLRAASAAKTLSQWASLSKQLCEVARSNVPFWLYVSSQPRARMIIRSHAHGRAPFSGCTQLSLSVPDPVMCCLAGGVLDVAQQWTALECLLLYINEYSQWQQQQEQEEEGAAVEYPTTSLLMRVRALQQLRSLALDAPALGACSAQLLLQLTHLTCLVLTASATAAQPAAAADLGAMSGMTRLVELHLNWALAPHMPASAEGPYCFPSSLVKLDLISTSHASPAPMAHWVAHLPGCQQLQSLTLRYGPQQHASTHPTHVARLLARHRRLHTWNVYATGDTVPDWGGTVAGLADAEVPVGGEWQPVASLAALRALRCLRGSFLCVRDQADWQQLAQMTALTELGYATFHYAPPLQGSTPLPLLGLDVKHCLDGHALGRLLLACPGLQYAEVTCDDTAPADAPAAAAPPVAAPALPTHPTLSNVGLMRCCRWGDAAAAVAQLAALAPVLSGVQDLELDNWPVPSARGVPALPDLSPCTALTALQYSSGPSASSDLVPRQEDFLSMVAPLVQLKELELEGTYWVSPQVALVLQYMLPQLQFLRLQHCGRLVDRAAVRAAVRDANQEQQLEAHQQADADEREAVLKVHRLLRPGLLLNVR